MNERERERERKRRRERERERQLPPQPPGERAQRASKGCTRPTTLAILMFAMLSPRWLRGASWCFALVLLAVLCASLLVFSVAVEACGLAPEQGYRLVLRLACFLSLPRDRARKFRKQARETHETLQLQTPGERALHVFAAFPGIEPESSEQKRSRNSRNVPAPNARRARAGEPQECPRRPQEAQNDSQAVPNDPQEGQNEPEEGQSELRELPGGFRERFGKDFQGISKQRDATELLGSVAGLGALAPLEIRGCRLPTPPPPMGWVAVGCRLPTPPPPDGMGRKSWFSHGFA